jgi:hypothetical protein
LAFSVVEVSVAGTFLEVSDVDHLRVLVPILPLRRLSFKGRLALVMVIEVDNKGSASLAKFRHVFDFRLVFFSEEVSDLFFRLSIQDVQRGRRFFLHHW